MTEVRDAVRSSHMRELINKKLVGLVLSALLFGLSALAEAQQAAKIPRIGYLNASSASSASSRIEAFRQGLRDLGYAEGKNMVVEYRYAEGNPDRLKQLTAELVQLKV